MCVVSNVGDYFQKQWAPYFPQGPQQPQQIPGQGGIQGPTSGGLSQLFNPPVTREEFDALRKEVLEMKDLLKKAKEIDEKTGQKDCEMEEKLKILRAVADAIGVSLDDVLPKKEKH